MNTLQDALSDAAQVGGAMADMIGEVVERVTAQRVTVETHKPMPNPMRNVIANTVSR